MDNKIKLLANTIVNHSIRVKEGDKVRIICETFEPISLVKELINKIKENKGAVSVKFIEPTVEALINKDINDSNIKYLKDLEDVDVDLCDAVIKIACNQGDYVSSIVSYEDRKKLGEALQKARDKRVSERKWVILNYPSVVDSNKAGMNIDEFTKFSFDAMCADYDQMNKDLKPLKELMDKTDKVRLVADGTDITFSIKDIPSIICSGECNIPDGEVYTAPVKNSINGIIRYNTPSPYQGKVFHHVTLEFKDGKIIKASCDEDDEALNKIFDTDIGARYVGEFSIGVNPVIKYPIGDILYDEKIIGSIHFTPGNAYQDADNGNRSAIHWDMVLIQREDYGGGAIYFDDVLIRKNGIFVVDSLKHLNK